MGRFIRKMKRKNSDFVQILEELNEEISENTRKTVKGFKKHEHLNEAVAVALLVEAADRSESSGLDMEDFLRLALNAWLFNNNFSQYDMNLDVVETLYPSGYDEDDEEGEESEVEEEEDDEDDSDSDDDEDEEDEEEEEDDVEEDEDDDSDEDEESEEEPEEEPVAKTKGRRKK